MRLTKVDHQILNSYLIAIEGLSKYLGTGYEIVLHSLEDCDHAAIKVLNGQHSGRKKGAPITDLALNMLSKIKKDSQSKGALVYRTTSATGEPIHACTIPILGEKERIIGLICINFYLNHPLYQFMNNFMHEDNQENMYKETFLQNTNNSIEREVTITRSSIQRNTSIPTTLKNKVIIEHLYDNHIFERKKSVEIVSKLLGISKNTVYLHIRSYKNSKND